MRRFIWLDFSAPESIDGDFNNWITSLEALSVRDAQAKFLERFYQLNES